MEVGHLASDCAIKKRADAARQQRQNKQVKRGGPAVSSESTVVDSFKQGQDNDLHEVIQVEALNASCTTSTQLGPMLDTGAQRSMSANRELFTDLRTLSSPIEIGGIQYADYPLEAYEAGTLCYEIDVNGKRVQYTVKDALYVPEVRFDVIAAGNFWKDYSISSSTTPDGKPVINFSKDGKLLFQGVFQDQLT
jgi:hypothetical protein